MPAEKASDLSKEIEKGEKKRGEVVRFVGSNNQDYITKYDAEVYGGGYIGVRRYFKNGTPVERPQEFEEAKSEKPNSGNVNYDLLPHSELKELGRAMKIRGWQVMKKENLIAKIKEAKQK